jgi:hypothetical protein
MDVTSGIQAGIISCHGERPGARVPARAGTGIVPLSRWLS